MSVLISQSVINYVEEENIPALKALLEKCKDVDERNECGQTPLMIAAEQGNVEIVKELIKNGANCNLEDLDNWTALISASKEGHIHIVEELLKCGANLEHRDMGGWTALMFPSCEGTAQPLDNSMGDSDCLHKHANNTASMHRAAESCIKSTVKIAKVTMSVSTDTSAEAL